MTGVRSALAVYKDEGEALLETLNAYATEQGIELIAVPLDEFAEAPATWLEKSRHVVAAESGFEQNINEAPASISVLTREDQPVPQSTASLMPPPPATP